MGFVREIEFFDLDGKDKIDIFNTHGSLVFTSYCRQDRILYGWYIRKDVKVKFYYKPSWLARQRMYWMHGWKWVDANVEA